MSNSLTKISVKIDGKELALGPDTEEPVLFRTGLFTDMSNEAYHNHIHLGSSGFKLLQRSPKHLWHASPLNPRRKQKETTRIMTMGTAWHTGIWEPHLFDGAYAAKPDIHPATTVAKMIELSLADFEGFKATHVAIPDGIKTTTKEGKALLAELQAEGKVGVEHETLSKVLELAPPLIGRTLLSADDLEAVREMSAAAEENPVTRVIKSLPGGMAEASIFAIDRATGAPVRIRPDYQVKPGMCEMFPYGLIVDGKSNDDSSREGFARSVWNNEMFFQAAFYSDVFQAHYGTERPPVFAWLAQERDGPYANAYYSAGADLIEYGRRRYRPLLTLFAECLHTGQWPGYPGTVQALDLPPYALKAVQDLVSAS